ncbi:MAG: DUF2971 domain-containing protein [Clostridium sp.]|nr:DUF2971 domain-containing protein [Acetatifactor muris]MCM1527582.1 DUF2971 domain-containing protein [Bacteroides sp.]MCM1563823.1 DUF2971 domain-containing protein [Clostridium sp.]
MSYKQLIENTIIPSTISVEEKNRRYNAVTEHVNHILPKKLYRFRNCTERTLSAFDKDELWFANGSVMNDDFDARLYYDKKKIRAWLKALVSDNGGLGVIENFINNTENVPESIVRIIPNAGNIFSMLKTMPRDQIYLICSQLIQLISNDLENEIRCITDMVQEKTKYACFAEEITSNMMWGQYTNNSTGFALEYEFGDENVITYQCGTAGQSTVWGNLFPIIYDNQRLDTTEYVIYLFQISLLSQVMRASGFSYPNQWINAIIPCPDEFMVTKLAIKKSNDWKAEKEWRMFYVTNDTVLAAEKYSCVKDKPSAVYLGRKISDINQKIIVAIAQEKNIPVFKMGLNDSSKSYKLCKYKIK